ncbi:MAG: hypothetical protein ACI4M6_01150 [Christensenellaceae bacterium]
MKKFAALCLIVFTLLSLLNVNAEKPDCVKAESYAMVISDDCPLYWDQSLKTVKFYLPKTYFVKIISFGAEYSKVGYLDDSLNYPETVGYVNNRYLDFSLTPDTIIYPHITVSLKNDDILFLDAEKTQPKSVIKAKTDAVYYGEIALDNELYVYCYTQGFVGYIRKSSFESFFIEENPKYAELNNSSESYTDSTDGNSQSHTQEKVEKTNPVTYVVFGVALAVILVIIYVIVRPEKNKKDGSFFGNDEF